MSSELLFEEMDKRIAEDNDRFRGHMGMSVIGGDDERKIWMDFHWCLPSSFEGRMLRLFDLGNHIEDQLVHFIKKTDVFDVSAVDGNGDQYRASYLGGHFGGSCDGFVKRVIDEDPEQVLVFEAKSANNTRFNALVKLEDYQAWSKTYQWQIHCYMGCFDLKKTMVVVMNKNNSQIYSEIIDFNPEIWEQAQEKAKRIISSDKPGAGLNETDWRLKNETEQYRGTYLGHRLPPSVNCRNCDSCEPDMESDKAAWHCSRFSKDLTLDEQKQGCRDHRWNPNLVRADLIEEECTDDVMAYRAGIFTFYNVTADKLGDKHFSSPEMRELSKIDYMFTGISDMEKLRNFFDGEFDNLEKVQVMDEDNTPF
jgi:hypothetical protein|tara:strand:- start:260 stop:1357 length:1098 start_codon:yes stop_codon:yes gene_type:complete